MATTTAKLIIEAQERISEAKAAVDRISLAIEGAQIHLGANTDTNTELEQGIIKRLDNDDQFLMNASSFLSEAAGSIQVLAQSPQTLARHAAHVDSQYRTYAKSVE